MDEVTDKRIKNYLLEKPKVASCEETLENLLDKNRKYEGEIKIL